MLNYRNISIIFITSVIIVSFFSIHEKISMLYLLLIMLFYFSFLAYGSFRIESGFYIDTISSFPTNEKEIVLSFDDGPDSITTPRILDVLKENKAKALFFVIGEQVKREGEILKRIVSEGHIVGNHSMSHSNYFGFFPKSKLIQELKRAEDEIAKSINKRVKFFRPPFGITNPAIMKAIKKLGYQTIGWNLRSLDTVKTKEKAISIIKKK